MRKILLFAAVLVGLFAVPATASALKFSPASGSPIKASTPEFDPPEIVSGNFAPTDIASGFFDDDIYEDIAVVADNSKFIYVYLGQADGNVVGSASNPVGGNSTVSGRTGIHATDLDGDGDDDLVARNTGDPAIEVYLNDRIDGVDSGPHESFGSVPEDTASLGLSDYPADYRSTSFNEDGDVAIGLTDNKYIVFQNTDGSYDSAEGAVTVDGLDGATEDIVSTALGDFDGDGVDDLAMSTSPEWSETGTPPWRVLVADGTGGSTFETPSELLRTEIDGYVTRIRTIDLNGDEYDDVIFLNSVGFDDFAQVALGSANGLVLQGTEDAVSVYGAQRGAIGDFDDDGNEDVAIPQFVDEGFQVALGDGTGKLALDPAGPFALPQIDSVRFLPQSSTALDLNGDGRLDFAAASGHSGDPNQARGVAIMLNEPAPGISVNPSSVDFGSVPEDAELVAPAVVTIQSTGEAALGFEEALVVGADANRFNVSGGTCQPGTVAAGSSCTVEVTVLQTGGQGPLSAELEIHSDATGEPVRVPLAAVITPHGDYFPAPRLSLKVKSAKKVKAGKKLLVTATVRNTGDAASSPVVLKASAPKKVAGKAKALKIKTIGAGKTAIRKFKIPVKRTAKGRFKVKVAMTHRGRTTSKQTAAVQAQPTRRR